MPLLFLSHSGVDTDEARELKRRLEASPTAREADLHVWLDKDDLKPGPVRWQAQLEEAIHHRSTAFAVYVGSKGVVNWVDSEVRLGLSRATAGRYPFIPILAAGVAPSTLPPFAAQYHGVRNPLNDPAEMAKLLAGVLDQGAAAIPIVTKEPFVGLRAMTEAESDRFFGRDAELEAAIGKLTRSRLLAVVADSGSGKSSLVQAGLVPRFRGGAFRDPNALEPDGRIWHVVVMRPGASPIEGLRNAVTTAAERLDLSPAVKAQLREMVDASRPRQIAYALQCDMPAATTETLLVVDQFEELFTQTPEALRQPFIDWLLSLVAPEAALGFRVVLTIRSDYVNLASAYPALFAHLKQDASTLRLQQLSAEGLARIVGEPLTLAGHRDVAEQEALIAQIRRDVSNRSGDLALVQMALYETWQRSGSEAGKLVEAYIAVGGVAGALAHAAEEVRTARLTPAEQAMLESVLVRLVTLGDTGGATRRVATIAEFDEDRQALIGKLAEERYGRLLLTGENTVEICHEQLLTQWPWWQNCINRSARDVRRLDRLTEKARDWAAADKASRASFLATGADLELFTALNRDRPDWLSSDERRFVAASDAARQRGERRRKWRVGSAIAAALLMAALAALAGASTLVANQQTRQAIANESRALAALSSVALQRGHVNDAVKLALAAWPRSESDSYRPRLEATLESLSTALTSGRLYAREIRHDGGVSGAVFNKDGSHILSWSDDQTLRLWDGATGQQIGPAMKHDDVVWGAVYNKDGSRILSWSRDQTLRLWDAATGQQIGPAMKHDRVVGAVFNKDGSRILSWSWDQTLRLWDAATGQPIGPAMKHDDAVSGAVFNKDGSRILSWSQDQTLRLWDATTGQQIGPAMKHDGWVSGAVFNKDESRILSWSEDQTLRLWDAATGQPIGPAMKHDGGVSGAVFNKDESRILSWSFDGTLRQWNIGWPRRANILEMACAVLLDHDLGGLSRRYSLIVKDPICSADHTMARPDWAKIERAGGN